MFKILYCTSLRSVVFVKRNFFSLFSLSTFSQDAEHVSHLLGLTMIWTYIRIFDVQKIAE